MRAGSLASNKWQNGIRFRNPSAHLQHWPPLWGHPVVLGMKISETVSFDGNWPFCFLTVRVILMTYELEKGGSQAFRF